MTEKDLIIEYMPQITEMAILINDMEPGQYQGYKKEQLEDTARTCPKALNFISNIFTIIEETLEM